MADKPNSDIVKLPFERAIEELESIVKRLEDGKVPLEESVAIYERGEALKKRCEELLRQAEARVEKITLDAAGKATGTEPLDVERLDTSSSSTAAKTAKSSKIPSSIIVIARSEATKQSSSRAPHWIASLTLAMTSKRSRSRGASAPEFCSFQAKSFPFAALENEGRRSADRRTIHGRTLGCGAG